jgi:sulfide:quinone oxidoreductase
VLVAGGGVAAAEAVLALHALAGDRVDVSMLSPRDDFVDKPASVRTPFSGTPARRVPLDRLPMRRHASALKAVDVDAQVALTTDGGRLHYDRLIIATGAHSVDAVPGATLFRGPLGAGAVEGALHLATRRAVFAAPRGCGWVLPIYELALLAAHEHPDGPDIVVVTPEPRPLDIFGPVASDAVARLLHRAQIEFIGNTSVTEVFDGALSTEDGRMLRAEAVIALPTLQGPAIKGLPSDADSFLEVDEHCRVAGVADVFAAGDVTAGPIKQGGLATQQADAAAQQIAAEAGAPVTPLPCRRVLRGVMLTGERPLFLRRDLDDEEAYARPLRDIPRGVSRSQLWWPDGKVAGRYLTGFLAGAAPDETLADRT